MKVDKDRNGSPAENVRLQDDPLWRHLRSPSRRRVREAERLTSAIGERLAEVLPDGEFRLNIDHTLISIDGLGARCGSGYSATPALFWYLPLTASRRLEVMFQSQTRELQRFLSTVRGAPWPGPGACPQVHVTSDEIRAWWGGASEADAIVRLRPIVRSELGL